MLSKDRNPERGRLCVAAFLQVAGPALGLRVPKGLYRAEALVLFIPCNSETLASAGNLTPTVARSGTATLHSISLTFLARLRRPDLHPRSQPPLDPNLAPGWIGGGGGSQARIGVGWSRVENRLWGWVQQHPRDEIPSSCQPERGQAWPGRALAFPEPGASLPRGHCLNLFVVSETESRASESLQFLARNRLGMHTCLPHLSQVAEEHQGTPLQVTRAGKPYLLH